METEKVKLISLIATAIFGVFIVISFIIFSFSGGGNSDRGGVLNRTIQIWSTVEEDTFFNILSLDQNLSVSVGSFIDYRYIHENEFSERFVNALAVGSGPDLVILPQDIITFERDKLVLNQYGEDTITRKTFLDTFLDSSEILDYGTGFLGVPIYVDPLVLFYNKDIQSVTREEIPKFWKDINSQFINNVVSTNGVRVERAAIPLGTGTNVKYAKEILLSILYQNDYNRNTNNFLRSVLESISNYANPKLDTYTWNNTLPESLQYFASNKSLLYIGYGSDKKLIEKINPSLNYGITGIPQSNNDKYITYNNMIIMAIPRNTKNYSSAFSLMFSLISQRIQDGLHDLDYQSSLKATSLDSSSNQIDATLNQEVKYGKSFFDLNYIRTNKVINDALDGLYSNRESLGNASFKIENVIR